MAAEKNIGWVIIAAMVALIVWIFGRGKHVIAAAAASPFPTTTNILPSSTRNITDLSQLAGAVPPPATEQIVQGTGTPTGSSPPVVSDFINGGLIDGSVRWTIPDSANNCPLGMTLYTDVNGNPICINAGDVVNQANQLAGLPLDTSVFIQ